MAVTTIFGTGPLGLAVARRLVSTGAQVRMVNRSGRATTPDGAEVVYHCATGAYGRWAEFLPPLMNGIIAGAAAAKAKLVYGDNFYAYGPVGGQLREDLPYHPVGPNTRARAAVATTLMDAHAAGKVRATIGRASDFYGPHARQSKAGDIIFGRALAGKPAQVVGDPDEPHTYTFIDDFAAGLVTLGQREEALGHVWHLPSAETITTRRIVEMVFAQLGRPTRIRPAPTVAITLMALFNSSMAAVKETMYQSEDSWVVDDSKFVRAFGTRTTPHEKAIAQTLAWFKSNLQS